MSTRKGGGFYGYKVHACVDVATELPVAWTVESANEAEAPKVPNLLDSARSRGFKPSAAILDRGYDVTPVYEACEDRCIRPIIPLHDAMAIKAGKAAPPKCEHGEWTCRFRRQAWYLEMAVPDWRVHACIGVDQS